jgi:hypothetical protein
VGVYKAEHGNGLEHIKRQVSARSTGTLVLAPL